MTIDERKYEITKQEDGSITCIPKAFIPSSSDIQEFWDADVFDKRNDDLDNITYLFKVLCYTNSKHEANVYHVLKYSQKTNMVEPYPTFTIEHPLQFNSQESATEAISIIGQEILLTLYKLE